MGDTNRAVQKSESATSRASSSESLLPGAVLETRKTKRISTRVSPRRTRAPLLMSLSTNAFDNAFDLLHHERKLATIQDAVADLLQRGGLASGSKMVQVFEDLAKRIERRIEKERVSSERWNEEASAQPTQSHVAHKARFMAAVDRKDNFATLNVSAEVLAMRPTTRRLVRLHDKQAFVQRSLDKQSELVHTGQGDRIVEDISCSQSLDNT